LSHNQAVFARPANHLREFHIEPRLRQPSDREIACAEKSNSQAGSIWFGASALNLRKSNFRFSEIYVCLHASRRRQSKGRIAIVTDVGSGKRWTQPLHQTSVVAADGQGAWS
jgi:hypothetical protein